MDRRYPAARHLHQRQFWMSRQSRCGPVATGRDQDGIAAKSTAPRMIPVGGPTGMSPLAGVTRDPARST
jgi:hypothetical protein